MTTSPDRIGRFRIRSPLGQGGMGTLYLAWDPELEREVAIKVLNRDEAELRERFLREARSAARLRHPHIVTVFDVGEHGGEPFIAMEYIPGVTLGSLIRGGEPLATPRKLELMEELCDGLAFAHREGIVHRDIKPANLMIGTDGALKILDFGVARVVQAAGLTQAGSLVGTLNYMSPEQVAGQQVDHRSDVFAVGVVLYELLSGRQAFPGGLADGVLNKILHGEPEPLAALAPELDPEVVAIAGRAMAKAPGGRYQDLAAMGEDLARVRGRLEAAGQAAAAPAAGRTAALPAAERSRLMRGARGGGAPAPLAPEGRRPAARLWRLVAAAAVLLLALTAFVLLERRDDGGPVEAATETAREEDPVAPPETGMETDQESPVPEIVAPPPPPVPSPVPPPAPAPAPAPVERRTEERPDRAGASPGGAAVRAPMPRECARLLERASLGERLTEEEETFLRRRCRSGGGMP